MELRYLGHAAFALTKDDATVLIDPFLTGNPKAPVAADEVSATTILLTHGHRDHIGDTVAIARRTGASVFGIVELANEVGDEGVAVHGANLGGTVAFDWGWVKLVPAWHTSTTPKGTVNTPAGLLISFDETILYHLGDTCLFSDLRLVRESVESLEYALMCIGGHYTMDRREAVKAAKLIDARMVVPCHYDTFPLIETDVEAFRTDVEVATNSTVLVLKPGQVHTTAPVG